MTGTERTLVEEAHEVIDAARRMIRHTDVGYLPVQRWVDELRDAVEKLDRATRPDPWLLLRDLEEHVPCGLPSLGNRVRAALDWYDDRVVRDV